MSLNEEDIYIGNKLRGENNNLIFKILDIFKDENGFEYVKVVEVKTDRKYCIFKSHFKRLKLIPIA